MYLSKSEVFETAIVHAIAKMFVSAEFAAHSVMLTELRAVALVSRENCYIVRNNSSYFMMTSFAEYFQKMNFDTCQRYYARFFAS